MKLQKHCLPLLAICAIALGACGDDDDDNNTPTPTTTATPQTQPQPQSTQPLWTGILYQREVTNSAPGACPSEKRMVIASSGTFTAVPCQLSDGPITGALTEAERTELNRVTNLMIEAQGREERVCQELQPLDEMSVRLTLNDASTYIPIEEDRQDGRCFRGPIPQVQEFRNYLSVLEEKYYPTVAPSPSPSVSPSVSPSPSASPSPLPSVSPTIIPGASPVFD